MTPAQLATLKTNIAADGTLNAKPMNSDGASDIKDAYNLPASPSFTVWKTNVPIRDVGDNILATAVGSLTTLNNTRLQTIVALSADGINASLSDRRAFFDDIFSGTGADASTRAKLLILWKRLATRAEKLYATGTGSDASPATLVFEGIVTVSDVEQARALP